MSTTSLDCQRAGTDQFPKIIAPKPIRRISLNLQNSTDNYSKSSVIQNFDKTINLDEIEKDFSLFKAKSDISFSCHELIKILTTPQPRSFALNDNNNNRKNGGIIRPNNPFYKNFDIDDV